MQLIIGNKNYSSWSLRPWLAMKVRGMPFDEKRIALYAAGSKEEILRDSPAGKVPILKDGATTVWDSLAILEYLAERDPRLWPRDARVDGRRAARDRVRRGRRALCNSSSVTRTIRRGRCGRGSR